MPEPLNAQSVSLLSLFMQKQVDGTWKTEGGQTFPSPPQQVTIQGVMAEANFEYEETETIDSPDPNEPATAWWHYHKV